MVTTTLKNSFLINDTYKFHRNEFSVVPEELNAMVAYEVLVVEKVIWDEYV